MTTTSKLRFMKRLLPSLIALALVMSANFATAQDEPPKRPDTSTWRPPPPPSKMGFGGHKKGHGFEHHDPAKKFERMADTLGLDDTVLAQIKTITNASKERMQTLHSSLHEAREKMNTLLDVDAPEHDAIMAQADVIGAISNDLHKERLKTMLKIRTLLTPDQRNILKTMREEHMKRKEHSPRKKRHYPPGKPY